MFSVGLCLPQLGGQVTREALHAFCTRSEALGFDGLWVQEHLFYPHEPSSGYAARPGVAVPDAYRSTTSAFETLSFAAAVTERVTIGSSILVAGYHRPVDLAQRVATLDLLSAGRVVLGLSVGWSADEHAQMDVEFTSRGRRCDELIDALEACWRPDPVSFSGEFFTIPRSDVSPKPLQRPRPRLLSGMRSGPGLRRTAERFDIWNPASGTVAEIQATRARLAEQRPAHLAPLEVYQRVFVSPPIVAPNLPVLGIGGLVEAVGAARHGGIDGVIVDANFSAEIRAPQDWADLPDRLSALLEAR